MQIAGFKVHLISALATARTREALHNSWDKNDPKDPQAIRMFPLILPEHPGLCQRLKEIEATARLYLQDHADYKRLLTIPGIGSILALTNLAEAGNLRRFAHYRQFIKFCSFDLCMHQSSRFRGSSKLSKYGNTRLHYAGCYGVSLFGCEKTPLEENLQTISSVLSPVPMASVKLIQQSLPKRLGLLTAW